MVFGCVYLFKQKTAYERRMSDWGSDVCSSDLYLERGREWLQEMGLRVRDQAELAAHGMASLVQGAARTMRAGLQTSTGDGFDALPALDHSPRQQQTPALDHGQDERDQQRQRQHDRDGPDIGFSREFDGRLARRPFWGDRKGGV